MSFKKIREEAMRVRDKYNPRSVADLENLASSEYGIRVIPTPYAIKNSKTGCRDDGLCFIIYSSIMGDGEGFSLAHEIGHTGAGHFEGEEMRQKVMAEIEADFFASTLLGMGYLKYFISKNLIYIKTGYDMSKNPEKYPAITEDEMLKIGDEIARGNGTEYDADTLKEVGKRMTS